jgi:predicted nucleic acid-binding protein
MKKIERVPVFVDAGPWIALMDPHDQWRDHALRVMKSLQATDRSLVTSNLVLMEAYSALVGRVERSAIAKFRATLRGSGTIRVERVDVFLEELAWQFFMRYDDKAIGMVDCTSFAIMEQWQIAEAFTFDRHFKQVGFQTLPRLK